MHLAVKWLEVYKNRLHAASRVVLGLNRCKDAGNIRVLSRNIQRQIRTTNEQKIECDADSGSEKQNERSVPAAAAHTGRSHKKDRVNSEVKEASG
jgi:transcriptional regulator with AAA-type ATPase domain